MLSDLSADFSPETILPLSSVIEAEMCLSSSIVHPFSNREVVLEEDFTSDQLVKYLEACGVDLEPLPLFSQVSANSNGLGSRPKDDEVPEPTPFAEDDCLLIMPTKWHKVTPEEKEQTPIESDIQGPSHFDVVCSRAKQFYQLPGCERFRQIVRAAIPAYMRADTRLYKSLVIASIIDKAIHHPEVGRIHFWKYAKTTWVELGSDQIRDKVGHALREMIQEMKRTQRKQTIAQAMAPASIFF